MRACSRGRLNPRGPVNPGVICLRLLVSLAGLLPDVLTGNVEQPVCGIAYALDTAGLVLDRQRFLPASKLDRHANRQAKHPPHRRLV